ncbi:hypothetical protein C1I98_10655 [Spongiactinospora gelatinilytica]|uniref:Uncharacterized protein n=1 Tax=Spongiactinospora gelatinilytica TaxID=2666298 RepID=A0A2W2IJX6_9ACTN|nr:hypothetical protein C1I98_10655 [Spongiactinospora gelatinilytica]
MTAVRSGEYKAVVDGKDLAGAARWRIQVAASSCSPRAAEGDAGGLVLLDLLDGRLGWSGCAARASLSVRSG